MSHVGNNRGYLWKLLASLSKLLDVSYDFGAWLQVCMGKTTKAIIIAVYRNDIHHFRIKSLFIVKQGGSVKRSCNEDENIKQSLGYRLGINEKSSS